MSYTGKIISLAFPDTFVKYSDESILVLLPIFGIGKNNFLKAGHAAFVLIENETGKAEYYDFGRYITPMGYGRVRSAITDVELEIPFTAKFTSENTIENLDEFLVWLATNPQKTHGDGRLVASVCDHIDYQKARDFVLSVQAKGSVPYKAFGKNGTNCSRIVTDTILAGTDEIAIRRALLRNKKFTPSTIGNVEKSAMDNPIYEVKNGLVTTYQGSAFKENITNYFDKKVPHHTHKPASCIPEHLKKADLLSGIGSSAFFDLVSTLDNAYEIIRYTEDGVEDFRGYFEEKKGVFDCSKAYKFVYDSNCKYCHIEQDGQKLRLDLVKRIF